MPTKRLHYYDQQFLVEADFTGEQKYHLDMRRRLTALLHTFGIATGLEVLRTGTRQVTVKAGAAVDSLGRELTLETDQVVDLSNLTTFPGGSTVAITLVYQETQTDPSTATGAPGNTRITEAPVIQALTTTPPTDGSVILLARFDKNGAGDIPGNPGDALDGGVRRLVGAKLGTASVTTAALADGAITEAKLLPALAAKINAPAGLVSLDGVSNPSGNIDLVAGGAITLTPDNLAKRIVVGENHSTLTNNPHATTAAQIGALLASQYDLAKRSFSVINFTQLDASGATRTIPLGFQTRVLFSIGNCSVTFGGRAFGGGSVGIFDISGAQHCAGVGITKIATGPPVDWLLRSGTGVPDNGICGAIFFDQSVVPFQAEALLVTVTATTTSVVATLTRTIPAGSTALPNFALSINVFALGN
jgi:hypothetical protein